MAGRTDLNVIRINQLDAKVSDRVANVVASVKAAFMPLAPAVA